MQISPIYGFLVISLATSTFGEPFKAVAVEDESIVSLPQPPSTRTRTKYWRDTDNWGDFITSERAEKEFLLESTVWINPSVDKDTIFELSAEFPNASDITSVSALNFGDQKAKVVYIFISTTSEHQVEVGIKVFCGTDVRLFVEVYGEF